MTNFDPELSIIIPTYRRERLLVETLESVFDQKGCLPEIIVVDQTQEHELATEEFLRRWEREGRLRWIRTSPASLTRARNVGLGYVSSDLVLYLDDDLLLPEPDTLKILCEDFADPRVLGVGAAMVLPEEDVEATRQAFIKHLRADICWNHPFLSPVYTLFGGFMSFRKRIFAIQGGFDEAFAQYPQEHSEEVEFCWRLTAKGRNPGLFMDRRLWFWHRPGPGGCGALKASRNANDDWLRARMEAAWYAYLRTPPGGPWGRLIRGWAFLSRAYALNQATLRVGPWRVWNNLNLLWQACRAARHKLTGARILAVAPAQVTSAAPDPLTR